MAIRKLSRFDNAVLDKAEEFEARGIKVVKITKESNCVAFYISDHVAYDVRVGA